MPAALIETIDAAVAQVTTRNIAQTQGGTQQGQEGQAEHNAAPAPAAPSGERWLRETLHALVGMRLSLFPPHPAPGSNPPPQPETAA